MELIIAEVSEHYILCSTFSDKFFVSEKNVCCKLSENEYHTLNILGRINGNRLGIWTDDYQNIFKQFLKTKDKQYIHVYTNYFCSVVKNILWD